jgi:hypothetical protein
MRAMSGSALGTGKMRTASCEWVGGGGWLVGRLGLVSCCCVVGGGAGVGVEVGVMFCCCVFRGGRGMNAGGIRQA